MVTALASADAAPTCTSDDRRRPFCARSGFALLVSRLARSNHHLLQCGAQHINRRPAADDVVTLPVKLKRQLVEFRPAKRPLNEAVHLAEKRGAVELRRIAECLPQAD